MKLFDQLMRFMFFRRPPASRRDGRRNMRLASRRAQNSKFGFIWCDETQDWRRCAVLDFSPVGARIELRDRTMPLPAPQDWLTLCIPDDDIEVDCQVVWRRGRHLGMHFSDGFRPITRYPPSPSRWTGAAHGL
jgi:hypothetical protein